MYQYHHKKIEEDHDAIISLFESMCEIGPCDGYSCLGREQFLQKLLHYTSAHFHREERLMSLLGYPERKEHMLAHAYLQNEFRYQLRAMPKEHPNLRADARMLREMFLCHILSHDDAMAKWVAQRPTAGTEPSCGTKIPRQGAPLSPWQGSWRMIRRSREPLRARP